MELDVALIHDDEADLAATRELIWQRPDRTNILQFSSWSGFNTSLAQANNASRFAYVPDIIMVDWASPSFDHNGILDAFELVDTFAQVPVILIKSKSITGPNPAILDECLTATFHKPFDTEVSNELQQIIVCTLMGRNPYPARMEAYS